MTKAKASAVRTRTVRTTKQIEEYHRRYMQFLNRIAISDRPLMKAAYYLFHLNHYAKINKNDLYPIKYKVLSIIYEMYKNTPYLTIQYVKGEDRVELCRECSDDLKVERKRGLYRLFLHPCAYCEVKKNYYSLLDLRIQYKGYKFHFHVPYNEIDKWFTIDLDSLPVIIRRKEKGIEKYGRVVTKAEREFLPLDWVVKELELFIQKHGDIISKETN